LPPLHHVRRRLLVRGRASPPFHSVFATVKQGAVAIEAQ
jgi:hypothetical protein